MVGACRHYDRRDWVLWHQGALLVDAYDVPDGRCRCCRDCLDQLARQSRRVLRPEPRRLGQAADGQFCRRALCARDMCSYLRGHLAILVAYPQPRRRPRGHARVGRIGELKGRTRMRADYVIVGAGSAGCVLANRLSEDRNVKVILIEAGGQDRSPYIHIPAGFMKLLDHPTFTWGFHAEPDPGTAGRAILYPRGKVIGGSSSINGLIYIRGQPEDYDHWAQLGNRGWSWDDCLPYFRKAERWEGEGSEVRGKDGPLLTSRMDRPPLCQIVIDAGKEIGLEYREDVNNLPPGAGDSIGWCQQTRGGRRRASAARTYLHPALKRPNLQLVTNALVHRILFDGKRATGVEFMRGGVVERVEAA